MRLRPDAQEIARTHNLLFKPGAVCEVRIPKMKGQGTASGYFNDTGKLIKAVTSINGSGPGTYLTLNPVAPALLARANNRIIIHATVTTSDRDIEWRFWLLIDIDTVRPAGISSTDTEHQAAMDLAREIRRILSEEGWPEPILADSGNGCHLLYRIDLPNNDDSTKLLKRVLEALARRFDNGQVKIDQSVFNSSRIVKLYGTPSQKGDDTKERPHRLSRIMEAPETLEPVPLALLEQLAASAAPPPRDPPRQSRAAFDVATWIRRHHLGVREPVAHDGGRKWVFNECPFNHEHKSPDAAVFESEDGLPGFKCFHNSCSSYGWRELRELIEGPSPRSSHATVADDGPDFTTAAQWPSALKAEAYHGPAGDLVRLIEPHTEGDPAALLIQYLVGFANLIGRAPYFLAEADEHHMNLFANLVGLTAKGRKGTSWGQVKRVHRTVDEEWATARVTSGLSSGEGLIWAVRDEIRGLVKERGKQPVEGVIDPGITDKRLLVLEGEFSRVLQSVERQGNTLSAVLRDSWDTGALSCLTKNSPARATGAHISIVGHITRDELKQLLTETSMANGFANRFLWVCSRRSKTLPEGGALETVDLKPVIRRLKNAADFARSVGEMKRDDRARAIWREVYPALSEGKPGLLGAVTSRAEAQVLRLSCVYALLDSSETVQAEHLQAALAIWEYCEASALFVFGAALGDATADEILRVLRTHPEGMTRSEISDHFRRHKSSSEIGRALTVLQEYGRVRVEREPTEGRPGERWHAI